jgi:hypothetical protein
MRLKRQIKRKVGNTRKEEVGVGITERKGWTISTWGKIKKGKSEVKM